MVGLLALVLTVAFRMAFSFGRVASTESARTEMQQTALIALMRLEQECVHTTPGGISASETTPVMVAFNPYKQAASGDVVDAAGLVPWSNDYHIYAWEPDSAELWSWTYTAPVAGSPLMPKKLEPVTLRGLLSGGEPHHARLARGVHRFRLEPDGLERLVQQPIKFTLELERPVPGRPDPLRYSLSRTTYMPGSR